MSKQMVRLWCRQFSEGHQSAHDEDGSHMARRTAAVLTELGWELGRLFYGNGYRHRFMEKITTRDSSQTEYHYRK
ncbi:hypothetical protein TNIN_356681 [Trichonephila inaurata madagascariensis]|uniref:Uncharacterized protein n=1 Tax=Trichonephila inaurata madagascariensis TaxID=2747483 RepID=A0A8X6M6V1_9ARAC|nr:hypothetical protein TNIN_356681 [Trichonephila inaurata madagascariensis]